MLSRIKRMAIIGLPGSGKSTFAAKLSSILQLPVYHLDKVLFSEDGTKRDPDQFQAIQKEMVDRDVWIIEGCSISTLEMRFSRADVVVYFRFPRMLCIWRAFKRQIRFNEFNEESGCIKTVNWPLLKYIWNFRKDKEETIRKLSAKYPFVDFRIVQTSGDLKALIKEMIGLGQILP